LRKVEGFFGMKNLRWNKMKEKVFDLENFVIFYAVFLELLDDISCHMAWSGVA
jgi:hypothetical protein